MKQSGLQRDLEHFFHYKLRLPERLSAENAEWFVRTYPQPSFTEANDLLRALMTYAAQVNSPGANVAIEEARRFLDAQRKSEAA